MSLLVSEDVILEAIHSDAATRKLLIAAAKDITDKIFSYADNPNCSCKSKILEWIGLNTEATNKIITASAYLSDKMRKLWDANLQAATDKTSQSPVPQSTTHKLMMGEMFQIEATPAAYTEFIKQANAERWVYRGLTVMKEKHDTGRDVWIIFIY